MKAVKVNAAVLMAPVTLVAGACGASQKPRLPEWQAITRETMVQAVHSSYDIGEAPRPSVLLTVEITNSSARAVFVPTRGRALLAVERLVDDQWVLAFQPIQSMELTTPARLQPGARIRDTAIIDLRLGVMTPPELDEITGTYRGVYAIFRNWRPETPHGAPGELLQKELRTSNPFLLRLNTNSKR